MTESPLEYNFEDLFVGQKANFLKKIDDELMNNFAKLSGDFNPLHMDEEYASTTNFGKRVCHGMLLASFFSQLVGMYLPGKNSLYFSQTLNFRNPCFVDDNITIEGEIIEKKSNMKLITLKTIIHNQTGTCLIDGIAKVIVRE
jgi:3-hydroxybutyryl-CoA dehydratase